MTIKHAVGDLNGTIHDAEVFRELVSSMLGNTGYIVHESESEIGYHDRGGVNVVLSFRVDRIRPH